MGRHAALFGKGPSGAISVRSACSSTPCLGAERFRHARQKRRHSNYDPKLVIMEGGQHHQGQPF